MTVRWISGRFAAAMVLVAASATAAGAHTEPDVVAVPAGGAAQVTLKPTHGCGESPTVEVATRVPVADAQAVDVPGWSAQASSEADATVLEWTGGVLPADEAGAFPVTFTAPDEPGELLTFPFVQTCEDGSELAWIDGDPAGEYPAPRLLVLAAGSEPASSIDDVPADAPGREQLVEIVDVDNPTATPEAPTTTASTTSPTPEPSTSVAPDEPIASAAPETADGDGSALPIVLVVGGAVLLAALLALGLRRRSGRAEQPPS